MSGGLAETVRWFLVTTAELVVLFLALSFLVGLLQAWLPSIPCGNRARGTTALGSTATTACRSTPTRGEAGSAGRTGPEGAKPTRSPATKLPRKVPGQERSKATVEAILEATARVLVRHGYERAGDHGPHRRGVGLRGGSLYGYFPNKESLVAALIERHAEELLELVAWSFLTHVDFAPSHRRAREAEDDPLYRGVVAAPRART